MSGREQAHERGERAHGRGDGPAVVAIGGGHGLAASIRAIRTYAARTTAIVATADDGGSTGRLRDAVDVPAPGDIRRCLAAMAGDDNRWADVIDYRFRGGDVDGHAVGNLLLAALAEVTGDFVEACDEVARLLGLDLATSRVLPATTAPVTLRGVGHQGAVEGQVAVTHTDGLYRVELVGGDTTGNAAEAVTAPKPAIEAIEQADQIVLGPGSLFTSVLAAAIVPEIRAALAEAQGRTARIYVCNLRAEEAETRGYDIAAHVAALSRHGIEVDVVLAQAGALPTGDCPTRVVEHQIATDSGAAHDPDRLGQALESLVPGVSRDTGVG